MRAWLQQAGAWGGVLFISVYCVLQPLGVRSLFFLLTAPMVWDPATAFALSWAGTVAASIAAFGFARFVARGWVQRRLPPGILRLDERLASRGLRTVLLLRLLFYTAPTLQFALGVSRVRLGPFVAGTILGVVPFTVLMTVLGDANQRLARSAADFDLALGSIWSAHTRDHGRDPDRYFPSDSEVARQALVRKCRPRESKPGAGVMNESFQFLPLRSICWLFTSGILLSAQPASAEVSCNQREAPGLFVDLFGSTRIYPNADAARIGLGIGAMWGEGAYGSN